MSLSILMFLAIVFALIMFMRAARIGALVAFLIAGVLSGPYILNLFELTETWSFLGDLGIMFLWFSLGLEINIKRLWNMRQTIFGFGAAQVLMVAAMLFPIMFTVTTWGIMGCVMVSLLLAMSSTSEDMQLLTDRNELNTNMGRQTFSILLFQDLLSIPLLAMLPVFTGKSFNLGATAIDILVLSVSLVLGVVIIGRFVLNPLMRLVARLKSKEAFLLAILLNIVVWATAVGMTGLPTGLGAFLAGMLMSETIYRHQISAEIGPYAMLFLAFFFISLGMGLNLPVLGQNWYLVLIGVVGLIALKFSAIFMVARVRGVNIPDATKIALILAQGGEFGLLMIQTMKSSGITVLPSRAQELLTAVIILSIMMTPLILAVYDKLLRSGKLLSHVGVRATNISDIKPDVVICGFGRVGQIIAQMLDDQDITYTAIDLDVNSVMLGRERGYNVAYGNTTNADVLQELGLCRKTRAVVIALDNAETARKTVLTVRTICPRAKIFARARNLADTKMLMGEGVYAVQPETIESSFFLGYGVLDKLGVPHDQIDEMLAAMRENNYALLDPTVSDAND